MSPPSIRSNIRLILATVAVVVFGPIATAGAGPISAGVVMPNVVAPDSTYATLARERVKVVRTFLLMPAVEPARGQYNRAWLTNYDNWVAHVTAIGAKPVIDVVNAPAWATGSSDPHVLPRDFGAFQSFARDYAAFLAMLARRYAGRVGAWEIWNEEDAPIWWVGAPDPARYAQLLKAAYPAVKGADPSATVVLGGLTGNDSKFLDGVYASGGGGSFDAVGVHTDTACNIISPYRYLRDPDGSVNQFSFLGYRTVHTVMAAHGQGSKPIWMTELGWATYSGICNYGMWAGQKAGGVSEPDQATFLTQALHCLSLDSSLVPVGIVFDLTDSVGAFPTVYGLEHVDGSPKPALDVLGRFDASGDQLNEGCGNFTGPSLTVASPTIGARFVNRLSITVTASVPAHASAAAADPSLGVARISLSYDGSHHIRSFTNRSHPAALAGHIVWGGAKQLAPGLHTLTFVAYDSEGNQTSRTVTVIHGSAGRARSSHRPHRTARRSARRRPGSRVKR